VGKLAQEFHGPVQFALHGFKAPAFWLALAGFGLATFLYLVRPDLPARLRRTFSLPVRVLEAKYGMDALWIGGFAGGGVVLGKLSRWVDTHLIDGLVNASARFTDFTARLVRRGQTGYLYHYAFVMILGLIASLAVLIRYWR
jgi:NADH-quinone oxidoreductase subunit L